ncbi:hypothetical protein [Mucilaginibacter lappiensis]|uniref:Type IV leader peptidase family protein n=1 Tax=Mucilaginibacter lappiensis TaxID=354630 RepID=A0A841J9V1_9SPHI|nr:hypothetical protein [Mucilaginibacter lappiensis]MBB6126366.1 hypothetical protein [Mucilaginibacter lappiensis]
MQLAIYIIIIFLLSFVFIQDMLYRAVTWYLFPVIIAGLLGIRLLSGKTMVMIGQSSLINFAVVFLILLLLTLYLWLRKGRIVNMTRDYLGIGDILFFGVLASYLSVLNFMFFFNVSLLSTILLYLLLKGIASMKSIPLAGFQALVFIVFLVADRWYFHCDITDDAWLLRLYNL